MAYGKRRKKRRVGVGGRAARKATGAQDRGGAGGFFGGKPAAGGFFGGKPAAGGFTRRRGKK